MRKHTYAWWVCDCNALCFAVSCCSPGSLLPSLHPHHAETLCMLEYAHEAANALPPASSLGVSSGPRGASTACVAALNGNRLDILNLGGVSPVVWPGPAQLASVSWPMSRLWSHRVPQATRRKADLSSSSPYCWSGYSHAPFCCLGKSLCCPSFVSGYACPILHPHTQI